MTRRVLLGSMAFAMAAWSDDADISRKRNGYEKICAIWSGAVEAFESSLDTISPDAMLTRVAELRKDAEACSTARSAYYSALDARAAAPPKLALSPSELDPLIDAIKRQQSTLVGTIRVVNRQIESFTADRTGRSALIEEAVERQRTALLSIQNLLVEQGLALEQAKSSEQPARDAAAGALARYSELAAMRIDDRSREETELWSSYYFRLAAVGAKRKAAAERALARPPSTPAPTTPAPAPESDLASPWVGTWVYSPNRPIFDGPEPDIAELVVEEKFGHLTGQFSALYKPRPPDRSEVSVRFSFAGSIKASGPQVCSIPDGGYIELLKGAFPDAIEVYWKRPAPANSWSSSGMVVIKK